MLYAAKCYWPGVTQADLDQVADRAARAAWPQTAQAKADLREIINDALDDLRIVEPEATSEERGTTGSSFVATPSFSLSAGGVRLRIDLWEGMTTDQPVPDDTMVLADAVMITNPSYPTELNSANIVYEQVGDRLSWQIYKFRSSPVPPDRWRWSKTVTALTAETVLELFQEAVDLRPLVFATPRYRYGPCERTHGLRHGEFFDSRERYVMIHPGDARLKF